MKIERLRCGDIFTFMESKINGDHVSPILIQGLYRGKRRNEVPPHIFAIAEGSYGSMCLSKLDFTELFLSRSFIYSLFSRV